MIDDPPRGKGFKAGKTFIQRSTLIDKMQMVFQNHVTIQFQTDLLRLKLPAVEQNLHGIRHGTPATILRL